MTAKEKFRRLIHSSTTRSIAKRIGAGERAAEAQGKTVVAVGWDGQAHGVFLVPDSVKTTSAQAISEMR
ncbi:Uncharacterised protein [Mycolicibacterium vanbaalenii]|uniref:Uncharacterized protein n=1 Tax=Mycolicibacterium vanbaalenii TaxID=110539 RepID=A0A5S9R3K2_MYCVN|nr:Uncharacterised protein [Mycolicibacterium vanbaalenii]